MANSPDSKTPPDDIATRIMAQMVRLPPKPHEEMKVGKRGAKDGPEPEKGASKPFSSKGQAQRLRREKEPARVITDAPPEGLTVDT
jgi:hypothetical protein